MTKFFAIVITASIIVAMIGSINILKSSYYWRCAFFAMQWDYLKNKIAYVNFSNSSINDLIFTDRRIGSKQPSSSQKADSIPILLYHGVIDNPAWQPDDVSISLSAFRDHLFSLKKAGYETITVEEYLKFIRGEKQLPEKSFLLTFDDGRKDSFYPVDPVLRTLEYVGVMNVITGRSLGPDNDEGTFHLSRLELKKMIESGRWEIESHGRDDHDYIPIDSSGNLQGHFLSDKMWISSSNRVETENEFLSRIRKDISGSRNDLEKYLGIKSNAFAYPFGDYGQESSSYPKNRDAIISAVQSIYPISFVQAGNSDYPTNFSENSFFAKRINVNSSMSSADLLKIMRDSETKDIPYSDNFSKNNGWIKGWGTMNIEAGQMFLSDSAGEDSGVVFLNGSYLWKNYQLNAAIDLKKGNTFALAARYADENNYIACDFTDGRVVFTQRVKGVNMPDIEILEPNGIIEGANINVGISADGDMGVCYIDGRQVVSGKIDDSLDHGGISFKIWDINREQTGNALIVKNLSVSPKLPSMKEFSASP